jgi:hypothetical protein
MYIIREGESNVGVHFVACHAVYFARGWISRLEMREGGPMSFSLHFNDTEVARTTNGVITRDNFHPGMLDDIDKKTFATDLLATRATNCWNMTYQTRVTLVTANEQLPTRQNYYIKQNWVQLFRERTTAAPKQGSDMDIEEVPTIYLFNLRADDPASVIHQTRPLEITSQ